MKLQIRKIENTRLTSWRCDELGWCGPLPNC
jgi:hypothetical protein